MDTTSYYAFSQKLLFNMEYRGLLCTDLYQTKYSLHSEYHTLFATANSQAYFLLKRVDLNKELDFYCIIDMMTYLPFERLGYEYLNKKLEKENTNAIEFRYGRIIRLFDRCNLHFDEESKEDIKALFTKFYDDVFEVNVLSLAIISLRLFHRFVTLMNFGVPVGGTMGIHKKIDAILDQITDDVNKKGLKEININEYLPEFDYSSNSLNEDMIEYIELCLKKGNFED